MYIRKFKLHYVFTSYFTQIMSFSEQPLKFPVQEFLSHCTVFRNLFRSLKQGIIWKFFLHKSFSSLKDLQLSCFEKNLIRSQSVPVFIWIRPGQIARPGKLVSDFHEKLGRWSLIFENCPRYPLGKTLLYNFHVLSFPKFGL